MTAAQRARELTTPGVAESPDAAQVADQLPPRRVLVVGLNYLPEPTGIAPYTAGLAEGLAAQGSAVHVITAFPHYPQWRIQDGYSGRVRHEDAHGVSITRFRPQVPRKGGLLARLWMELAFGLRAATTQWRQPDVAVLVSPALFSSGLAMLGARVRGVPTCVWVQDIYSLGLAETGRGQLLGRAMQAVEQRVLRSAESVVVIHERFRRHLVDHLGLDPDRVVVVRNWSHLQPVETPDLHEVRRSHGWADDDVVVLHAGNIGAKQGLENVVAAGALGRQRGSRVRFVLLGDGNQRAALQSMPGAEAVDFIDPLPDAEFQATLHAADILLVNERPGLREMCVPSKLTSYFSTGLPVIAATDPDSITAEEMAIAGGGVRIDAAQPDQLLAAAEALGSDPQTAAAYGESGLLFRRVRLDPRTATRRFGTVLHGLVNVRQR